jgi:ribosomal protein L25 (general stress protein Ctc)
MSDGRAAGLVPGIIYGKGLDGDETTVMVAVPERELEREMRKMEERWAMQTCIAGI